MGKHILCLHLEISDKASQHLTDSNWLPSVNQSLWPGEDALIGQSEYMINPGVWNGGWRMLYLKQIDWEWGKTQPLQKKPALCSPKEWMDAGKHRQQAASIIPIYSHCKGFLWSSCFNVLFPPLSSLLQSSDTQHNQRSAQQSSRGPSYFGKQIKVIVVRLAFMVTFSQCALYAALLKLLGT